MLQAAQAATVDAPPRHADARGIEAESFFVVAYQEIVALPARMAQVEEHAGTDNGQLGESKVEIDEAAKMRRIFSRQIPLYEPLATVHRAPGSGSKGQHAEQQQTVPPTASHGLNGGIAFTLHFGAQVMLAGKPVHHRGRNEDGGVGADEDTQKHRE